MTNAIDCILFLGFILLLQALTCVVLKVAAETLFRKKVTFTRAILTQLVLFLLLPVWLWVLGRMRADSFVVPQKEVELLWAVALTVLHAVVVTMSFGLGFGKSLLCLVISLVPPLFVFDLIVPHGDLGGARAYITKANGEMRAIATDLKGWHEREGRIPLPVDQVGNEIDGTPRSASGETILVYYEGTSLVPPNLKIETATPWPPIDSFKRKASATYSFAIDSNGAFILSSWGPDEVDQSEEVEHNFLIKCEGDTDRFRNSGRRFRLAYSPTNGVISAGELFRIGRF